jgi:hypothetical protein
MTSVSLSPHLMITKIAKNEGILILKSDKFYFSSGALYPGKRHKHLSQQSNFVTTSESLSLHLNNNKIVKK